MEQRTGLRCAGNIRRRRDGKEARVGVVLGSGLEILPKNWRRKKRYLTRKLKDFRVDGAESRGKVCLLGLLDEIPSSACRESSSVRRVFSRGSRVAGGLLSALGVKILVLTNAAGSVNPSFVREISAIRDHISSFCLRPDRTQRRRYRPSLSG